MLKWKFKTRNELLSEYGSMTKACSGSGYVSDYEKLFGTIPDEKKTN